MSNGNEIQVDLNNVHGKIFRYLELKPKNKDFLIEFNKLDKGYCAGISALWLYAKWVQTQPKAEVSNVNSDDPRQLTQNDDYVWFKSTIEFIADWDEKRTLTPEEASKLERLTALVEYYQHIYDYRPASNNSLDKYLENAQKRTPTKEYSIASLFTLEQLKQLLKIENIIQDNRLILVLSHKHATGLFKNKENYYYFDSNNQKGEIQTTSTDELAKLIFNADFYTYEKDGCRVVESHYTKPSPLGFEMFSFEEATAKYPIVKDVLDSINPSLSPVTGYAKEESGLTMAAKIDSLESARYFLEKKIAIDAKSEGRTALMHAALNGYTDVILELLAAGANPNLKEDKTGGTILMMAVIYNHADAVKALLANKNLDPNVKVECLGQTPLMVAAWQNKPEIVEALMADQRTNPNIRDDKNGCTALMLAVAHDSIDAVKVLLSHQNVDLSIIGEKITSTPFMLAVENNKVEIVKAFLVSKRIDLNIKEACGNVADMTALMRAALNGHVNVVEELLVAGANPNVVTKWGSDGWTALMLAIKKERIDVVKAFLANQNVDYNAQTKNGETALILAIESGNTELVRLLLEKQNIDPNLKDAFDKTPLMDAVDNENVEIVRLLLKNPNTDPNIRNKELGETALMQAAVKNNVEIIELLLASPKIDPNITDHFDGWTALMYAVVEKRHEAIKALLANQNVNPNILTNSGFTALMVATEFKQVGIIKMLQENKNIALNIKHKDNGAAFAPILEKRVELEMRQLLEEVEKLKKVA